MKTLTKYGESATEDPSRGLGAPAAAAPSRPGWPSHLTVPREPAHTPSPGLLQSAVKSQT